jgi:hypothetical protein
MRFGLIFTPGGPSPYIGFGGRGPKGPNPILVFLLVLFIALIGATYGRCS